MRATQGGEEIPQVPDYCPVPQRRVVKPFVHLDPKTSKSTASPADYPYPPVDLLGGVDSIASKAAVGAFSSQYEFDQAFYTLFALTYGGHLGSQFCTAKTISY